MFNTANQTKCNDSHEVENKQTNKQYKQGHKDIRGFIQAQSKNVLHGRKAREDSLCTRRDYKEPA